MNFIDIIMAKKLATQDTSAVVDKVNKVAEQAQIVANEAEQTLEDANAAVETANTTNDSTKQLVEQAQGLVNDAQSTLDTLAETVNTADEAVQKVAAIEEQATAAAEKAQAASDSFDTMKEDLLTAAEGLVDEAVVEVVNRELTNLNAHMDQVDTTVKGFESTVASYDEKINYLTDTLPEVNAAAFEADKAARTAQATADNAKQVAHDANLLAQTLDTTTGILGAQLTSVADKVDSVEEGISNLQTQQSATDLKIGALETNIGDIENTVDEVEATVNELKSNTLDVTLEDQSDETADIQELTITKGEAKKSHKFKTYKTVDESEDGAITPKAAKVYVDDVKAYLEQKIEEATAGGGISNLGPENAGKTVFVGEDGNIAASTITEDDLVKIATVLGMYQSDDVVGLEIDYVNKSYSRLQGAMNLTPGTNFDKFEMYGGRKRCIVDNTGKIVAFEGEMGYNENGSTGQVMVYQPKFYYLRVPAQTTPTSTGIAINREELLLSDKPQAGFNLHPIFKDASGKELDYVLLPAYPGSAQRFGTKEYVKDDAQDINFETDMLSSISDSKPISGLSQNLTIENAEKLANHRGDGWHITNMEVESVNQMLMSVEYGSMNLQTAFARGISDITQDSQANTACISGSTSSLGSKSGSAESTSFDDHTSYEESGKVAISYRGMENPYGNIWHFVRGIKVEGHSENNGGTIIVNDNDGVACKLPNASGWLSSFGYDSHNSWLFVPAVISNSPNSSLPVGDFSYVTTNLNGTNNCIAGGKSSAGDNNGPFYFSFTINANTHAYSVGANLMYIPTKDSENYTANYQKWLEKMGG